MTEYIENKIIYNYNNKTLKAQLCASFVRKKVTGKLSCWGKIFYFEKRLQSKVLYWTTGGSAAGPLEGGIDLEENSLLSECRGERKKMLS
jgi:hypothetical protein